MVHTYKTIQKTVNMLNSLLYHVSFIFVSLNGGKINTCWIFFFLMAPILKIKNKKALLPLPFSKKSGRETCCFFYLA